ncbi:MAG: phosphate ABC transporter permease subunit PstC, partial [Mesorhizobium sp.]
MSSMLVLAIVVAVGLVAFFIGRQRAVAQDNGSVKPHSRAHYHGWWAFLLAVLPALLLLAVWNIGSSIYLDRHIHAALPERTADSAVASEALDVSLVKSLAKGLRQLDANTQLPASFAELQPLLAAKGVALATDTQDYMIPIAVEANAVQGRLGMIGAVVTLALSIAGAFYALRQVAPRARARNNVERLMLWGLLA